MMELKQVSRKEADEIIEKRNPTGLFYTVENGVYVGVDNSTGDAWTEDFKSEKDCLNWLNGKEVIPEMQKSREEADEIFGELRRFETITEDESRKRKLVALIVVKKLSREDLILILSTLRLNPNAFPKADKKDY